MLLFGGNTDMKFTTILLVSLFLGGAALATGVFPQFIGVIWGGSSLLSKAWARGEERFQAGQARISASIPMQKKRTAFYILLGVEAAVVLLSAVFSSDRAEWAYSILSCTPVGGILNFFYNPNDFSLALNLEGWVLSGLNFLLLTVAAAETEKLTSSKLLTLVHSILFTFFIGAVCQLFVKYVVSNLLLFSSYGMEHFYPALRIFPLLVRLALYAVGVCCLVLMVRTFIEDVKTLLFVLIAAAVLLVILLLLKLTLAVGHAENTEAFSAFTRFAYRVFFELPKENSILAQGIVTVLLTVLYNVGVVFAKNSKSSLQRYRASEQEDRLIEAARAAKAEASGNPLLRAAFRKKHPEVYEQYQTLRETKTDEELIAQAEAILQRRQAQREEENAASEEDDASGQILRDPAEPEEAERLRRLIADDVGQKLVSGRQKKLATMPAEKLCKKYVSDVRTLESLDQGFRADAFASKRLNFRVDRYGYTFFSFLVGFVVFLILFLGMRLMWRFNDSALRAAAEGISFAALVGAFYTAFTALAGLLSKSKKIRDTWLSLALLLPAVWFAFMLRNSAAEALGRGSVFTALLAAILCGVLVGRLVGIIYLRRLFSGSRLVRKLALMQLYMDGSAQPDDELAVTRKDKKAVKDRNRSFDLMVAVEARYDELRAYLQGKGGDHI